MTTATATTTTASFATQAANAAHASLNAASLHNELHRVLCAGGEEEVVRTEFRRVAMEHAGAIGVAHLIWIDGQWRLSPEHCTGRVPNRADFVERFGRACDLSVQRKAIQIEQFLGLESIVAPMFVAEGHSEVLLVLVPEKQAAKALFVLEIATAYFSLWLRGNLTTRANWKLISLAALVELVSEIERQPTLKKACHVVANEIARHLGCDQVALASWRDNRVVIESLSGVPDLDAGSDTYHVIEMALTEAVLRDDLGIWPPRERDETHLLLAHKQLVRHLHCEATLTCPLKAIDGKAVGAMLLTGPKSLVHGNRLPNFVRAAAPRLATALEVVRRAEPSRIQQSWGRLQEIMGRSRAKIAVAVTLAVALMLCVPMPYRIRCSCVTEVTQRRFAVAPFQGTLKQGRVRPGDRIASGQVLAEMDGAPIRFELAGAMAELAQAEKRRDVELAEQNVLPALLADLETQRLTAKIDLLRHQQSQLLVRSPVEGVVLSGSLERAQAAAVQLGQVLYELGPLQPLRIELQIPADEVGFVEVGQSVRVWVSGLEDASFTATIERLRPRSELREQDNVFVAELLIANQDDRLRPGMEGVARISSQRRPLAWSLFHKPFDYLRTRLTWW
ncbi:MAG: HlyD family efflux transporter periplasmic adaptor subunit [Planctomycetales bacterium]|nr:HlyD family efflux transporter periplasmic adaptor subunit [Planctomycetales bacterium]